VDVAHACHPPATERQDASVASLRAATLLGTSVGTDRAIVLETARLSAAVRMIGRTRAGECDLVPLWSPWVTVEAGCTIEVVVEPESTVEGAPAPSVLAEYVTAADWLW
jgi:hypothetical protein